MRRNLYPLETKRELAVRKEMDRQAKARKRLYPEPGYCYVLMGKGSWKNAPDYRWDTGVLSRGESDMAEHVGQRTIDGMLVEVFRILTFHVAQLPQNVRAYSKERARR